MRIGISVEVSSADRARLEAIVANRNSPQKHVWRARIVLLIVDGLGTNEIMRRGGKSKSAVWRWQECFMQMGVDSLLCDRTRPSRIPPLGAEVAARVVEGFFAKLTKRRLKRGVFRSIVYLQAAINRFLAETNDDPKPFVWTKDPDKIIAAVNRERQVLDSIL
jgi:Homeodomain-like domain